MNFLRWVFLIASFRGSKVPSPAAGKVLINVLKRPETMKVLSTGAKAGMSGVKILTGMLAKKGKNAKQPQQGDQ